MSSLFFVSRCLQLCHPIQGPATRPRGREGHTQAIVQSVPTQLRSPAGVSFFSAASPLQWGGVHVDPS